MKSLILIFIALGCGLVASIGISQVMDRGNSGGGSIEMEQILVALNDIDIGAKLDAQNVRLEDWPKAKVPEGAIRKVDDVKDKFTNSRFFKGEPIHVSRVTDQLGNISVKVPQGYRAVPVKVDDDTVMKAISPGDRVDIMVFLRRNLPDIPETGAFTILKNVRVFAINQNTERASDSKGESTNFKTVSLLVKPDHARELAVAAQMGKILLTLRRPDELDAEEGEEVTPLADILRGGSKLGSDPPPANNVSSKGSGIQDFLTNLGKSPAGSAPSTGSGEPKWTMEILGPAERRRFEWLDEKGLPIESTVGTDSATTSSTSAGDQSEPTKPEGQSPDDENKLPPDGAPKRIR